MAQQVKGACCRPDDLSSMTGNNMVEGKKTDFCKLSPDFPMYTPIHIHTCAHNIDKCDSFKKRAWVVISRVEWEEKLTPGHKAKHIPSTMAVISSSPADAC